MDIKELLEKRRIRLEKIEKITDIREDGIPKILAITSVKEDTVLDLLNDFISEEFRQKYEDNRNALCIVQEMLKNEEITFLGLKFLLQ